LTPNPIAYPAPPHPPSQNGPETSGNSGLIRAIAWTVIVACLAFVAYVNWRSARTPGRRQATEHFQLQLSSRVALGEIRTFHVSPRAHSTIKAQAIAHLDKLATDPGAKLRFATMVGEVEGGESALDKLDAVARQVKTPEEKADLGTLRLIYQSGPAAVSQERREKLVADQGWFGELALSFGQPDSDPLRAGVMRRAVRAFAVTIGVEGAAVLAALAGLGIFIFFMIRLANGRLHLCYGRAPTLTTAFLEAFAVYLAGYVGIGMSARLLAPQWMYLGTLLSLLWMPVAMLWPLARGLSWAQLAGGLGWYRGTGVLREVGAGITGYVAGLPLILIAMIVTAILTSRTESNATHPIVFGDKHGFWTIVELYLLAAVLAPLIEETMFRGALFTHLRQRHGWLVSAIISAFIFAALHPQGWTAIPALGTIGFVFAGIREWRGTFIASAAAHAMNNAVVATVLVLAMR
jgi:membrane protease YdiL (CAAX protease family)